MGKSTIFVVLTLILFTQSLYAFTEDDIQKYEEQSYELLYNDNAIDALYEGDLTKLPEGFSDFNLSVLDARELRILRNMYFAQYGYRFKSSDLHEWFSQFEWYESLYDNVNHLLGHVDTMIINRIKHFESAYKTDQNISVLPDDLVGIWHASPMVAAGYSDLLYFFPDGRFEYAPNQMDWSQRLSGMYGTWQLDHNRLTLSVNTKAALVGGEIVEPTASCASEFAIEGGHGEALDIEPPEKWTFPISNIITGEFEPYPQADMERINIGGSTWWKMSSDPYLDLP